MRGTPAKRITSDNTTAPETSGARTMCVLRRRLLHLVGVERQPDEERGALAAFSLEVQRASMLVDDDAVCNGEALAGSFSDFFGREERVEDLVARGFRD